MVAEKITVQDAVDNRETEHVIVVSFTYNFGWIETVLYDSRKTPYDVPYGLSDYTVDTIEMIDDDLTMIII